MPVVPSLASSFATAGELATHLGTTFDSAAIDRAETLIEIVSSAITEYTGRSFVMVTGDAITLDGRGAHDIVLPDWPVVAITEVKVATVTGTGTTTWATLVYRQDYEWTAAGVLSAVSGAAGALQSACGGWSSRAVSTVATWPRRPRSVAVTYDHGYDDVPELVKGLCLQAAARSFTNPTAESSEAIGNYSVSHGATSGLAVAVLTQAERAALAQYRGVLVA